MRHILNTLFILAILCSIASCNDDNFDDTINTNSGVDCDIVLDDFTLSNINTSFSFINNFSNVTFESKELQEVIFSSGAPQLISEDLNFVSLDSLNYCFNLESSTSKLISENGIEFTIVSESRPYYPEVEENYAADVLKIFYNDTNNPDTARRLVFRKVLDLKNHPAPLYSTTILLGKKLIIDREFDNVEFTDFNDPIIKLYFNDEFGIIGFEDESSTLWKFKEKN